MKDPESVGRDEVAVLGAELKDDGRTVFLRLGEMVVVDQMRIQFRLQSQDGKRVSGEVFNTVNWVD